VSLGPFPASSDQHQGELRKATPKKKKISKECFASLETVKKKYCTHNNNRIKKRGKSSRN
jgi:hypothetical protein